MSPIRTSLVVGILLSATALASQRPIFKSRVDLVRVDLLVVRGGQPVAGLTADDFEVVDNGVPQDVERVSFEEAPIDVLLVFDNSRSVAGPRLLHLVEAGQAFLGGLGSGDRAGLLTFSQQMRLEAEITGNLPSLQRALDGLTAAGSTALLDAVYAAAMVPGRGEARQLILLFSDGIDNTSWLTTADVVKVVRESDAVIYSVSVKTSDPAGLSSTPTFVLPSRIGATPGPEPNTKLLETLATETGGRLFFAEASDRLRELFTRILHEMKVRYLLTYYPQGVEREGWHTLQIRLKKMSGEIITRRGYYVPAKQ